MSRLNFNTEKMHNRHNYAFGWIALLLLTISSPLFAEKSLDEREDSFRDRKAYWYEKDTLTLKSDTFIITRRAFLPDHYILQYAGNIGFMAIGAGYDIGNYFQMSILYGFLNEQFGDSKITVSTVSFKHNFTITRPLTKLNFSPTAGMAVNWGYTENTFHKLPEHYPNKYYFQNKVHLAPYIGGNFSHNLKKSRYVRSLSFYYEVSSLDAYILEWIRRDYIKLSDIISLSIGIKLAVD